jgi:hypothetical protein
MTGRTISLSSENHNSLQTFTNLPLILHRELYGTLFGMGVDYEVVCTKRVFYLQFFEI